MILMSDIDMSAFDIPSQQLESLFVPLQSDFISKKELDGMAPFQNMFNQSSLSNNEHDSSVLKPRSPWEDESYHLDNFIPFLPKSKKMKLSDISGQNLPTNSASTDPQTTPHNSQELREIGLLERSIGIMPDELIPSHRTGAEDSTAKKYDGLSLLVEARLLLDHKSNANFTQNEFPIRDEEIMDEEAPLYKQRPRLYPGYKPGKSFVDDLIWKEGGTNCYPEPDLTSPESYSLQHVHLLTQQISGLIEGEADNNRRIQAIKESYKDSSLSSLHENLDSTLLHSLDVLMECQNACQSVSIFEEHVSSLSRILVDRGVMKLEDNSDSD